MGITEVARKLPAVLASYARLARLARANRPRAAVLVDYAEYNQRLGRHLRSLGIPVLRCVAPQVWAWRPGRLRTAGRSFDRLAVILPFEEDLWRGAGVDARYVGHPAVDVVPRSRREARELLGIAPDRACVALLPGSRRHEVRTLAPRMLDTLRELSRTGRQVDARLALAPSLDEATRSWLRARAAERGVPSLDVAPEVGAGEWLAAFDATLAASGTVTLEAALAGAPPVIVYRVSAVTAAIARRLIKVPSIGLPNVLLGRRAYPELLQNDAEPAEMARALGSVLDERAAFEPLARELREAIEPPRSPHRTSHERIAAWMSA
jgi:lipid-A-disaccharide synthase